MGSFIHIMRGSRGGSGGPDPPWNLQSLLLPILLDMKKLVIFHVKVGHPLEKFSGSAPAYQLQCVA